MNVESILKELTFEEKAALLQGRSQWTTLGIPALGIPELFLSDGPHGLCKQTQPEGLLWSRDTHPATCFPTAASMANSWDPELGEDLGKALGAEAAANDVHVVLGPGLNVKRSPLCGRNFEYFSEDPYLAGKMAAAYIRGIQSKGPAACPKHFAANSQELRRMASDSVVDERTLREIYLTAFEIAVREGQPKAIMSAYNMVNGTYCNENRHLLTEILRDEWGFDGIVITDWGADNEHTDGIRAGSNLVMPSPGPDEALRLLKALKEGRISEEEIDARLREFMNTALPLGKSVAEASKTFDREAHHALARKCAAQSIVLLDNDGILPLKEGTSSAIIGDFARTPRYQGAGSSLVKPTALDCFYDFAAQSGLKVTGFAQGFRRGYAGVDPELISEAVSLAKNAEIVLLCVGLDETAETEGLDRRSMELPDGQTALIHAVAEVNPNVILVLSGGAPFLMPDRSLYRAAIHGYLGGQAGGSAMADAITGKICPCGKLSESWPLRLEDTPTYPDFPSREQIAPYREALYVGYRYYDTAGISVRYPFGHGLSYTSFDYSALSVSEKEVSFTVKNTGSTDGAEVAQVYISLPQNKVFRPRKELKGFSKVFLCAGESKRITVPLDDKAFRYFNVKTDCWEIEGGSCEVSVGSSSNDIRLTGQIAISGTEAPLPYGSLPHYESGQVSHVTDEEFETLLGRPTPKSPPQNYFERNDTIGQLGSGKSFAARLIYGIVDRMKRKGEKKSPPDLNALFIFDMTFRGMSKLTAGLVSSRMVDDLLLAVNGHFFRGLGRLIADFFRNKRRSKAFLKKLSSR